MLKESYNLENSISLRAEIYITSGEQNLAIMPELTVLLMISEFCTVPLNGKGAHPKNKMEIENGIFHEGGRGRSRAPEDKVSANTAS